MTNKTVLKSSMEYNRHELETLNFILDNYNIRTRNDAVRLGLYALRFIEDFSPDLEQFKSDMKYKLKHEKIYLRDGVKKWLKI